MALSSGFLRDLERLAPVLRAEPMARHTTLGVGGPAEAYVTARDCQQLAAVASLARRAGVALRIVGGGSNLLVSGRGIAGVVVETWSNTGDLAEHPPVPVTGQPGAVHVHAFAGTPLPRLAHQTAKTGLSGLEWASGIPGTVGGGVVNNAGAHGGCMADVVAEALVLLDGEVQRLPAGGLGFGYRHSHLRGDWADQQPVVLAAEITLRTADAACTERRLQECLDYRRTTQPAQRSVGSIFKNPPGDAAGRLIDQAGLKGSRHGDAEISAVHANFIVNRGHATAADVNALIALAQQQVQQQFGVALELEIERVGDA